MQSVVDFLQARNQPDYRLDQFNQHFYQQFIHSFAQLTTWSKQLRSELADEVEFSSLEPINQISTPGKDTTKAVFSLKRFPQHQIETVLMQHRDGRNTICVSCMVGCPVGCSFCATGQMGLLVNLRTREIIDQILYFARSLNQQQQTISNIVYMGMGEPMLNLEAVEESIDIITNPKQLAMSKRRITVSTVGYVPQLKQFLADGYYLPLAVSLHAPTQELRQKIIPVAKLFDLDSLFEVLDEYVDKTNKRISYEYILLAGVNDRKQHAQQLAALLKDRLAHVNLIPYNPVEGAGYQRPTQQQVNQFSRWLEQGGVSNTIRVTMGDEIKAACGQLRTG